ncbi:hypothetical protein D3C76_03280 [compost metagenome]
MKPAEIYLDTNEKYGFSIDEDKAKDFLEAWEMLLITANLLGYNYYFDFQVYSKYSSFDVCFGNVDTHLVIEFNLIGFSLFNMKVTFNDDESKVFRFSNFAECFKECQDLL